MISRLKDFRLHYPFTAKLRTIVAVLVYIFIITNSTVFSQNADNVKESLQSAKPENLSLPGNTYIVVDDDKQFGEILKRLGTPDFQISRPSPELKKSVVSEPSQSFINSISITGSMSGSFLQTSLVVRINQNADEAVWTKIGLNEILLQSVTESNKPLLASTRTEDRSWHVKTIGKGVHEVNIQFAVEINFDRSSRRVAFSIPESPETSLSLDIPERVLFASTSTKEALKLNHDKLRNLYQIQGQVSPRNKLDLRWFGQSILSNQPSTLIECRGMISMRMDLDSVSSRQQWLINGISGIPENIEFNMPSGVNITDLQINGQSVRPTFEKNINNTTKVSIRNTIQNETLTSDPISLDIVTRQFYTVTSEVDTRETQWSTPEWINMSVVSGVVAIELPQQWVISSRSIPNLQSIDPRDLPDRLRKTTATRAFEFHGALGSQKIRIQKIKNPLLAKSQTVGLLSQLGVEYLSQFEIEGDISPNNEYTFALPQSAQVLFVGPKEFVERYVQIQEPDLNNQKVVQFFLNQNLKANDKFQLRIRYLDKMESDQKGRLAIPRIHGTLNHEATALLIASNKDINIHTTDPEAFDYNPSVDIIESLKALLGKSFDNASAHLRLMDFKKKALYYQSLSLKDEKLPFEINQIDSDILYRTELEVIPEAKSFLLKYKFHIDKFSKSHSSLEFQINPQYSGSNDSGKIRVIQDRNITSLQPIIKEGSIIVNTNFLKDAPFIIEYEVRMNHVSQEVTDSSQLRFDMSKTPAISTARLLNAECLSMMVFQKSTTNFIPNNSQAIAYSSDGNRDVSLGNDDILFLLNDPTQPIPVMTWSINHSSDIDIVRPPIQSMQIVNKTFEPGTWHVIYDLAPNTNKIILPKIDSQILGRVEINGTNTSFDQTDSEYVVKLLNSEPNITVVTLWTNTDSKSTKFTFPYPSGINQSNNTYPVEICLISSPDSIIFFSPFRRLTSDSISIGHDNIQSFLSDQRINGFKIVNLSSINDVTRFSYIAIPIKWATVSVLLFISCLILTAFLVKNRKRKLVLLAILFSFSIFSLAVNDWYLEDMKLFGIMISSTIISATVLFTNISMSPKHLFAPIQNNQPNNAIFLPQVDILDKEPSTVLKHSNLQDSQTRMNTPVLDTYSDNQDSRKDWNLGFDLSD